MTNRTERIEMLRDFILKNDLDGMQTFDCRNTTGDPRTTIYSDDEIVIDSCCCLGICYLEIFGLTEQEYENLADILDIC